MPCSLRPAIEKEEQLGCVSTSVLYIREYAPLPSTSMMVASPEISIGAAEAARAILSSTLSARLTLAIKDTASAPRRVLLFIRLKKWFN